MRVNIILFETGFGADIVHSSYSDKVRHKVRSISTRFGTRFARLTPESACGDPAESVNCQDILDRIAKATPTSFGNLARHGKAQRRRVANLTPEPCRLNKANRLSIKNYQLGHSILISAFLRRRLHKPTPHQTRKYERTLCRGTRKRFYELTP